MEYIIEYKNEKTRFEGTVATINENRRKIEKERGAAPFISSVFFRTEEDRVSAAGCGPGEADCWNCGRWCKFFVAPHLF